VQLAPATIPLDGAREGIIWAQKATGLPALLYTMLYLAAENKTVLESSYDTDSLSVLKSSQDAIWLRGEAINCLNKLLQESATAATESTILCVSIMNHCEVYCSSMLGNGPRTKLMINTVSRLTHTWWRHKHI
jgi:hypothetical protein